MSKMKELLLEILELHESGFDAEEISNMTGETLESVIQVIQNPLYQ